MIFFIYMIMIYYCDLSLRIIIIKMNIYRIAAKKWNDNNNYCILFLINTDKSSKYEIKFRSEGTVIECSYLGDKRISKNIYNKIVSNIENIKNYSKDDFHRWINKNFIF